MKAIRLVSGLIVVAVLAACSSAPEQTLKEEQHENLQRDYRVVDASSQKRPGWIEDAQQWAKENGHQVETYRFFSFETDPKTNRELACSLAKANARADVAGEITTIIQKSLGYSTEGAPSADGINAPQLREFVENTLAEKVQAMLHGVSVIKSYWEKRNYDVSLGAPGNYSAYTCAVLLRMEANALRAAINKAAQDVVKAADDPDTKANVKNALKNIDQDFLKARAGEI